MWSDKAFEIWMGHAGEDSRVFTQDEPSNAAALDQTRFLAVARWDVTAPEAASRSRAQLASCEPEGIAA